MNVNRIFKIIGKYYCGIALNQDEVDFLAFTDLMEYYYDFFEEDYDAWCCFKDEVENVVIGFLSGSGVEDDDQDKDYSDNPYHLGFTYNDYFYVTDYTGNAGNYWNGNDEYYICRP